MQIKTYRTHPITTSDLLPHLINSYVPRLTEKSILVITSKIISLCEGSVVAKDKVDSKEALVRQSADAYLDDADTSKPAHAVQLTIKNNILIPAAGIDESNGNGLYILYPKNIQHSAVAIWEYIRERYKIQKLGVLITDSHTTPMRRGVMGIGLGWCGFKPLYNYIGKPDCFGATLRVTMTNNLDSLAAAAVFCMGEGNEQTPFAVITEAPKIEFQDSPPTADEVEEISIPLEEDLYLPLLKNARWVFRNQLVENSTKDF